MLNIRLHRGEVDYAAGGLEYLHWHLDICFSHLSGFPLGSIEMIVRSWLQLPSLAKGQDVSLSETFCLAFKEGEFEAENRLSAQYSIYKSPFLAGSKCPFHGTFRANLKPSITKLWHWKQNVSLLGDLISVCDAQCDSADRWGCRWLTLNSISSCKIRGWMGAADRSSTSGLAYPPLCDVCC